MRTFCQPNYTKHGPRSANGKARAEITTFLSVYNSFCIGTYLCNELSFMDMQVRSADTARLDLDQDIVLAEFWERHLDDAVVTRLRVAVLEGGTVQLK